MQHLKHEWKTSLIFQIYTLIVKTESWPELIPGDGLRGLLLLRPWVLLALGRLTVDQHCLHFGELGLGTRLDPDLFAASTTNRGRFGFGLPAIATLSNDALDGLAWKQGTSCLGQLGNVIYTECQAMASRVNRRGFVLSCYAIIAHGVKLNQNLEEI